MVILKVWTQIFCMGIGALSVMAIGVMLAHYGFGFYSHRYADPGIRAFFGTVGAIFGATGGLMLSRFMIKEQEKESGSPD